MDISPAFISTVLLQNEALLSVCSVFSFIWRNQDILAGIWWLQKWGLHAWPLLLLIPANSLSVVSLHINYRACELPYKHWPSPWPLILWSFWCLALLNEQFLLFQCPLPYGPMCNPFSKHQLTHAAWGLKQSRVYSLLATLHIVLAVAEIISGLTVSWEWYGFTHMHVSGSCQKNVNWC